MGEMDKFIIMVAFNKNLNLAKILKWSKYRAFYN